MANHRLATRARGAKAAAQRGRQEITSAILGTLMWKQEAEEMAADLRDAATACDRLAARLPTRPEAPERVVSVLDYLEHTDDRAEPVVTVTVERVDIEACAECEAGAHVK